MPSTTSYKRSDVVLVPFPFTDLSAVKQRPAVVVSSDAFNANHSDVILAAITSQVPARLSEFELAIPSNELAACGLPKPSVVKASKLVTIHQGIIRRKIGTMTPSTVGQVLELARKLL
jgi:mRNA interferase MazF